MDETDITVQELLDDNLDSPEDFLDLHHQESEKKNDDIDRHHYIIEDQEMAKSKYTAKHLYALNACRDDLAKFSTQSREDRHERYTKAADEYDELAVGGFMCWIQALLSQKRSYIITARHFRNNCGLGAGKYLVIMYDENWFWGLSDLKVLSEAEICENARIVWNDLPNHQVASAYIQAHRITIKVSKAAGDNSFLGAVEKASA
jgi:hypothetical protein